MSQRAERRSVHGGGVLRLLDRFRRGRACLTPLCLTNIAASLSVVLTSLSVGGSTTHGLAGGIGAGLAVAGVFWGAERAGERVQLSDAAPVRVRAGRGWPLLAIVLTALTLMSLGAAALTGLHLGSVQDLASVPGFPPSEQLDPAVLGAHRWAASFALFITPMSLTVTMLRHLAARAEARPSPSFLRGAQ